MGLALVVALAALACGDDAEPPEVAPASVEQPGSAVSAPVTANSTPVAVNSARAAASSAPSAEGTVIPAAEAAPTPTQRPARELTLAQLVSLGETPSAPELAGINSWINSEPFTLESQRGNVVLVDFWTYSCINCIRTMPYLKEWHEKYADEGLVIVGVHTPEFQFEMNRDNVIEAAMGFGLEYPIAQDNDYITWRLFQGRRGVWPAKYLIDRNGLVRYTHFGEGAYEETELRIQELLAQRPFSLIEVTPEPREEYSPMRIPVSSLLTRELYAGLKRNLVALPPYVYNAEYYAFEEGDVLYEDPGKHSSDFIYLQGLWHNGQESLRHARTTENNEDYIAIAFFATSVNAVISPEGGEPYEVKVTLDGGSMEPDFAGADIMFDSDGDSFIIVDEGRLYNLVETKKFALHELTLSANSPNFSLYTFTFGGDG